MKSRYLILVKVIFIIGLFLIPSALFNSCDKKDPTSPTSSDYSEFTQRLETANFIFHYTEGDSVQSQRQEAFHQWTIRQLGVTCPKKIDYYKYRDRNHIEEVTGIWGDGWADPALFTVHGVMSFDNHECVHLYTSLIGRPTQFFNEGIAVAFQTDPQNNIFEPRWQGEPVHSWAKRYKNEGKLIPINNLLESDNFSNYSMTITYPEAGSFVRYIIDNYGLNKMKSILQQVGLYDSNVVIRQKFQSVYGFSINQAENEWLDFLDEY